MDVYYNEIDDNCCQVLNRHIKDGLLYPGFVDNRDIREVSGDELKQYKQIHLFAGIGAFPLGFRRAGLPDDFTIITGGFPCQDVSVAGGRAGLAGERSGLWFEFHRIIQEIKPEWVVIENVPGLLSSNGGRDMGTIVGGLAKCGYWWAYRVLDAQYFGVPQRRRRVFIVGHLAPRKRPLGKKDIQNDERFSGLVAEVLFERDSSPWDIAPRRETGAGTSTTAIRLAQTSSNGWGIKQDGTIGTPDGTGGDAVLSLSNRNGQINDVTETIRSDCHGAIPMVAFGSNNTKGQIANTFNGYTGGVDDNDAQGGHLVWDNGQGDPNAEYSNTSYCLNGQVNQGVGVRRLAPIECGRLQGFPDDYTANQSDSARYRQLGNAVAVPVVEWLGKRLLNFR